MAGAATIAIAEATKLRRDHDRVVFIVLSCCVADNRANADAGVLDAASSYAFKG
jgi:hypothetical protein